MELEKQYVFAASRDSSQCRSDALDTLLYNNQTSKLKVYYLEANIKEVTTDSEIAFSDIIVVIIIKMSLTTKLTDKIWNPNFSTTHSIRKPARIVVKANY